MNFPIDITPITQAIIALLTAIITVFIIPFVKAKIGEQNISDLLTWVDIAVKAAEQIYKTTEGKAKKEYVLRFLRNKGYILDENELDNVIEAAVLEIHSNLYGAKKDE